MSTEDTADVVGEGRRLLAELEARLPEAAAIRGECRPAVDVIETAKAVAVVADLPGVPPDAIRVGFRHNVLIVAGVKAPAPASRPVRVHVVERGYGRFLRFIRIDAAIDVASAKATLGGGQLRVTIPRVVDRRGHFIEVAVERHP